MQLILFAIIELFAWFSKSIKLRQNFTFSFAIINQIKKKKKKQWNHRIYRFTNDANNKIMFSDKIMANLFWSNFDVLYSTENFNKYFSRYVEANNI